MNTTHYPTIASSPTPAQVTEGKARIERGERLPEGHGLRPWFCRSCGARGDDGPVIPHGWYSLSRHVGISGEKPLRLGVYCSAACLDDQMPRLIGVEADAGTTWQHTTCRQQATPRSENGRDPDNPLASMATSSIRHGLGLWRDKARACRDQGDQAGVEAAHEKIALFLREVRRRELGGGR